jgi:hypothetical protein
LSISISNDYLDFAVIDTFGRISYIRKTVEILYLSVKLGTEGGWQAVNVTAVDHAINLDREHRVSA